jgi:peptidoglycan/xylan/chitin deacetylase (PgdA/CDA1 family)
MKRQVIVTTSWDDGDPLDLRVAELLRMRGLVGTFYVPITGYLGRRTIQAQDMRDMIRDGFEIGAHSYSHRSLYGLESFELEREVRHCRTRLEEAIGQPVSMFCYPNGRYDQATLAFVKKSGYAGARTTRMLCTHAGENRFEIPTTVQAFPHAPLTYVKNALKGHNFGSIAKLSRSLHSTTGWIDFGMRTFDYVLERGGVWHLYGHSWELEDFRLWDGLRTLLDYVAHRNGVEYRTNGELVARVYGNEYASSGVAA